MKKVFSVKKFKECCKKLGLPKEDYERSCNIWANECDGLTKDEMKELGYLFNDNWAIEVEERKMPTRKEFELMVLLAFVFVQKAIEEVLKEIDLMKKERSEENGTN